jgi:hypothetical protein
MYSLTDRQSRFNTYILMSISFYLLILSAELMPVVCFVPILSMAVSLSKCIAEIIWKIYERRINTKKICLKIACHTVLK